MSSSLQSLLQSGTKLWLDSIDPDLVQENYGWGATGATSNPIIIANLIEGGRFDADIERQLEQGLDDHQVAWRMTDMLVWQAQDVFLPVWQQTRGNDGYVSFELDPLLEDPETGPPHAQRVARYIESGRRWSADHQNRMIKVPATTSGIAALPDLVAWGVTVNVTLIFTQDQYRAAREAVWRGAQQRDSLQQFKSVYSIFVSRVDVYTEKHVPQLSAAAQGMVGIVNAKRMWADNRDFWRDKGAPLEQEIIFASTGTKKADDPPWKYVAALAGSDIQTNPPATNAAVARSGRTFDRQVDRLPADQVLAEIDAQVDDRHLHATLMEEGIKKFADPQRALLQLIGEKRSSLSSSA